jgi:hypothetical protein
MELHVSPYLIMYLAPAQVGVAPGPVVESVALVVLGTPGVNT